MSIEVIGKKVCNNPKEEEEEEKKDEEVVPITINSTIMLDTKTIPQDQYEETNNDESIEVEEEDDDGLQEDTAILTSLPLTYQNTKNSSFYKKAKAHLQTGNFEAGLTKVGQGLTTILSLLESSSSSSADGGDELHPSLVPLYYLYGTTLLYSIEESQENPEQESLVTAQATAGSAGSNNGGSSGSDGAVPMDGPGQAFAEDLQIAWENLETARSILDRMLNENNNGDGKKASSKSAGSSSGDDVVVVQEDEYILDLAQIHSRLGDLSRHNGHYKAAIHDYELCCTQRRSCLTKHCEKYPDGTWDRRIADVEYTLAISCLMYASEGEKNLMDQNDTEEQATTTVASTSAVAAGSATATAAKASSAASSAATAANNGDDNKVILTLEQIQQYREDSMRHYLECGRILGGIIGSLCGKGPEEIGGVENQSLLFDYEKDRKQAAVDSSTVKVAVSASSITKNTEDDVKESSSLKGEESTSTSLHAQVSKALEIIRERASNLSPLPSSSTDELEDKKAQVEDLREMLDEIQETIDTCEKDREGLRDVSAMRKKAEEEAAKSDFKDGQEDDKTSVKAADGAAPNADSGNGVTTIGFGTDTTMMSATGNTTVGVIDSSSKKQASNTVNSLPMMVVKKKKKKRANINAGSDQKRFRTG